MKKLKRLLNEKTIKMTKIDYIIIGIIIALYSILSFINLGTLKNPQTFCYLGNDKTLVFELTEKTNITRVKFYSGDIAGQYVIYGSLNNKDYDYITTLSSNGVFAWNDEIINANVKYIKLLSISESYLGEVAFYNNKQIINIKSVTKDNNKIKKVTDELETVPKQVSHLNSSYFDEIYFAKTSYDYKEKLEAYEWVHPPLGKMIQAIPVILFNKMSPFFYRLMGNIFGIFMLFIMYLFGKQIFKMRKWAIISSLLMFFDTFHFTQTRIGTIDSFLVFFIMLSLYFMYKYISNKNSNHFLFLSGLFFGLSVCIKWTGFLSGLALAVIYFIDVIKHKKNIKKAILFGAIYFIIVPLIMYISFYLIYPNNQVTYTDSIKDIFIQTKEMFKYHSTLEESHFFSSEWYTWPLSYKPVWYYTKDYNTNVRGTITAIGNIIIWWLGIVSIPYLVYKVFRKKEKESLFLLIVILSLWLPYIFISRVMFLYHYFPVTPFMMLAVVRLLKEIENKTQNKTIIICYMALVITFFILYYPVISGMPVTNNYIDMLKLLDSWYF